MSNIFGFLKETKNTTNYFYYELIRGCQDSNWWSYVVRKFKLEHKFQNLTKRLKISIS